MRMHFWGLSFAFPIWWDFGGLAPTGMLMDGGTSILWTGGRGRWVHKVHPSSQMQGCACRLLGDGARQG